jgi:type II secretory pathway component PulF
MPARSKIRKALRLAAFAGILIVELSLIAAFYVVPQFEAQNAPLGRWEMETPFRSAFWLPFVLIAFFSLFALGNIGLLITIRRAVKDLKLND